MNSKSRIVSVSDMAKMVGLSRSRFYSLLERGFFPAPQRGKSSSRPFYDLEGQLRCLEVRETGIGVNGEPHVFQRKEGEKIPIPRSRLKSVSKPTEVSIDLAPIIEGLRELGLTKIKEPKVKSAIDRIFPKGIESMSFEKILPPLFTELFQNGQNESRSSPPDDDVE